MQTVRTRLPALFLPSFHTPFFSLSPSLMISIDPAEGVLQREEREAWHDEGGGRGTEGGVFPP